MGVVTAGKCQGPTNKVTLKMQKGVDCMLVSTLQFKIGQRRRKNASMERYVISHWEVIPFPYKDWGRLVIRIGKMWVGMGYPCC